MGAPGHHRQHLREAKAPGVQAAPGGAPGPLEGPRAQDSTPLLLGEAAGGSTGHGSPPQPVLAPSAPLPSLGKGVLLLVTR